ncbi:hypothetical protein H9655_20680 [Cytobacillus sp. Sa5YUA1]|uniref:Phage protein n=1 Tax=Cytobacillus stercorigallinarum TaxID=2762240 RepID=A0ABR8QVB1_9BACI|nr:hypothetical protein [Cytobacillus stercorigallinarum]MBD7939461.1 hypothetical protein [Cytobacillus stercorigallinarum]
MQKKLIDINNEADGIMVNLEVIEGQMIFFGHLIEDMRQYPDAMASDVRFGQTQKQLSAIYTLFYEQLKEIGEYQETISKLSSEHHE